MFPAFVDGREQMLTDVRKLLDRLAARAGWRAGEIRTRLLRHAYRAARLQTLDDGAPVSIYTVARELGHQSDEMVQRIYAHLGATRHRSSEVEYRLEQHLEQLGDRVQRLGGCHWEGHWRRGRGHQRRTPRHRSIDGGRSS